MSPFDTPPSAATQGEVERRAAQDGEGDCVAAEFFNNPSPLGFYPARERWMRRSSRRVRCRSSSRSVGDAMRARAHVRRVHLRDEQLLACALRLGERLPAGREDFRTAPEVDAVLIAHAVAEDDVLVVGRGVGSRERLPDALYREAALSVRLADAARGARREER